MAPRSEQGDAAHLPDSDVRRHGGWFAVLALGSLLAVRLPLPWLAVAVVFVVAADVEGVRLARALTRAGGGRTVALWCICGVVLISLLGVGVLATVALYPVTHERQQCLQGANTHVARAACQDAFDRRVSRIQVHLVG